MHNLGGLNVPWASDPLCEQLKELSSWLKTMKALVGKLGELETAASRAQGHQPQLVDQVTALRIALKGQQDRCIAFLQLTEECSERFLTDVGDEIKQRAKQTDFLSALNNLLDKAEKLRERASRLQKSYEDGMSCISVKKVQQTGTRPTHRLPTLRRVVEACISSSAQTTQGRRCRFSQRNGRYPD